MTFPENRMQPLWYRRHPDAFDSVRAETEILEPCVKSPFDLRSESVLLSLLLRALMIPARRRKISLID